MVLEALERDDIKRLPGGIFTRAFLRSYAVEVGLDPDTTVDEFLAQFPPESVTAGTVGDPVEDHQAIESDRRAAQTFVRLMAVSLPIAAVVIYFSVRPSPPRDEASTRPSMTAPVSVAEKGSKTPPPPPTIPPPVKPTEVVEATPTKTIHAGGDRPIGDGSRIVSDGGQPASDSRHRFVRGCHGTGGSQSPAAGSEASGYGQSSGAARFGDDGHRSAVAVLGRGCGRW